MRHVENHNECPISLFSISRLTSFLRSRVKHRPLAVITLADLTWAPSDLTAITLAVSHSPRWVASSHRMTRLSTSMSLSVDVHFERTCSVVRYSSRQIFQKAFTRACTLLQHLRVPSILSVEVIGTMRAEECAT